MIELQNEVEMNRPVEQVWRLVGDPTQWHLWRDAMSAPAVKIDNGSPSAGSEYDYRSAFMGREVEAIFKVIAYEPRRKITVTTDKPLPVRLSFHLEAVDEGTRVIQKTEGEVGGFFGLAEPLIKPLMKRQFQKDLEALKNTAENQFRVTK